MGRLEFGWEMGLNFSGVIMPTWEDDDGNGINRVEEFSSINLYLNKPLKEKERKKEKLTFRAYLVS